MIRQNLNITVNNSTTSLSNLWGGGIAICYVVRSIFGVDFYNYNITADKRNGLSAV